jgi:tRNA_anti-like
MKKKIFLAIVIVGAIVGSWAVWYVFFKPHRDFTLTTSALSQEFKANNAEATKKYIDKALLLEGTITAIDGITVSFDNVACNVDSTQLEKLPTLKVGASAKLQGRLTGYNDLLEEIDMSQCVFK